MFYLKWCCIMPGSSEEPPTFIVATLRTPRSMGGGRQGLSPLDLLFSEGMPVFYPKNFGLDQL